MTPSQFDHTLLSPFISKKTTRRSSVSPSEHLVTTIRCDDTCLCLLTFRY